MTVTANDIANMLRSGTNFASIDYVTEVKTAAAHKAVKVTKAVTANVQLFQNIREATEIFAAAVRRTATGDADAVANFSAQDNYFEHTDCFSIVRHKKTGREYLYAIYNNATSEYQIDSAPATTEAVALLLTPSAARDLLQPKSTVTNVTHGIEHTVRVRTIALDNISAVRANRQVAA